MRCPWARDNAAVACDGSAAAPPLCPWGEPITAMRQLLLLRHAKSSWDDGGLPDRERPLNPRGRTSVAALREAMRNLGLLPDLVLLSPAARTRQTLAALEPWEETPLVDEVEALYLAEPEQILETLRAVPETTRGVMLVGHNPGLHELTLLLIGPAALRPADSEMRRLMEGFPTAGLVEFAIAGPWSALDQGGARLQRFLDPRELPPAPMPAGPN